VTNKELKLIEARINVELVNIDSLLAELEKHGLKIKDDKKLSLIAEDSFFLRAIGSILHDFYVAVENIFEILGREIDEHLPGGSDWHIQLLQQMALEVAGVRTAVISKNTFQLLDKYRSFRHVFRNVYGFSLEATRLKSLVDDLNGTTQHFRQDIETFLNEIESILE
jgi:hypothetical protein